MPWIEYEAMDGQRELVHWSGDVLERHVGTELQHLPPGIPESDLVRIAGPCPLFARHVATRELRSKVDGMGARWEGRARNAPLPAPPPFPASRNVPPLGRAASWWNWELIGRRDRDDLVRHLQLLAAADDDA
jgi:hypothetical protein